MKIEAIDLFCGIGGLTCGLREANIDVLAGLDNDETCSFTYEKNNGAKFISADIAEYDFRELKKLYSKNSLRVLVGCAPCQPFSSHTNKNKNRESDTRWNLIDYFIEAVRVLDPHVISMENVRGITKTRIFDNFIQELEKLGYSIDFKIVYCPDYGIPQSRSRLVLMGSKIGKIQVPSPTHTKNKYKTVQDIIGKLPPLRVGEVDKKDHVHCVKNLNELNLKRIRQSKPSGSWKDWDKELLPNCYRKASGKTYVSVYGRMSWENVSPTMTTQFFNYGSGRFGHPEQDRALSLREGALLQTFPKGYDFGKIISMTRTAKHIGNAVPPRLGFVIGKTIKEHFQQNHV
ncbi:MAG: DNA (cytosine-5-)-methyltransferase [Robiginitomaculum sp.]|nr:DNA (cytosine-5-)-methyltransferase [Robiginitomaculum sp.]